MSEQPVKRQCVARTSPIENLRINIHSILTGEQAVWLFMFSASFGLTSIDSYITRDVIAQSGQSINVRDNQSVYTFLLSLEKKSFYGRPYAISLRQFLTMVVLNESNVAQFVNIFDTLGISIIENAHNIVRDTLHNRTTNIFDFCIINEIKIRSCDKMFRIISAERICSDFQVALACYDQGVSSVVHATTCMRYGRPSLKKTKRSDDVPTMDEIENECILFKQKIVITQLVAKHLWPKELFALVMSYFD
jgi:hypothetical protein